MTDSTYFIISRFIICLSLSSTLLTCLVYLIQPRRHANCSCNYCRDNFLNVWSSASNRSVTFSSLSNSNLGRSLSPSFTWLPPPPPPWCHRHPRRCRWHYSHRRIRRHIPSARIRPTTRLWRCRRWPVVVYPFKSQRGIIPVLPFAWLANHRRRGVARLSLPQPSPIFSSTSKD